MGVKMVPPGTHFVTYAVPGRQGGYGACTGFFLHVQLRQVVVKKFDPQTESLQDLPDDEVRTIGWLPCIEPKALTAHALTETNVVLTWAYRLSALHTAFGVLILTVGWRRTICPAIRSGRIFQGTSHNQCWISSLR